MVQTTKKEELKLEEPLVSDSLVDPDDSLDEEGFKPGNVLEFKNGDSRFRYRWVKKGSFGPDGKDIRGWQKVSALDSAGEARPSKKDLESGGFGDEVVTGDLVLAKMSVKRAEARNKHYRERNSAKLEMIQYANKRGKDGMDSDYSYEKRVGNKVIEKDES